MSISISSQSTIGEIRKQFHQHYPFLTLGFFNDANLDGIYTASEQIKEDELTLAKLGKTDKEATFLIHNNKVIHEIEQSIKDTLGVIVQVFYKRGESWLVATNSDGLTLKELNTKAEALNIPIQEEGPVDATDRMELE